METKNRPARRRSFESSGRGKGGGKGRGRGKGRRLSAPTQVSEEHKPQPEFDVDDSLPPVGPYDNTKEFQSSNIETETDLRSEDVPEITSAPGINARDVIDDELPVVINESGYDVDVITTIVQEDSCSFVTEEGENTRSIDCSLTSENSLLVKKKKKKNNNKNSQQKDDQEKKSKKKKTNADKQADDQDKVGDKVEKKKKKNRVMSSETDEMKFANTREARESSHGAHVQIVKTIDHASAAEDVEKEEEVSVIIGGIPSPVITVECMSTDPISSIVEALSDDLNLALGSPKRPYKNSELPLTALVSTIKDDLNNDDGNIWELFENHDTFAGDHALTKPFHSAEEAMRLCLKQGFGGFVATNEFAYFRRQSRIQLKDKKIRCVGSVLYVAPMIKVKPSNRRDISPRPNSPRPTSPRLHKEEASSNPTTSAPPVRGLSLVLVPEVYPAEYLTTEGVNEFL
jgi:hypothetical protein